jgi:hypothetical protein
MTPVSYQKDLDPTKNDQLCNTLQPNSKWFNDEQMVKGFVKVLGREWVEEGGEVKTAG